MVHVFEGVVGDDGVENGIVKSETDGIGLNSRRRHTVSVERHNAEAGVAVRRETASPATEIQNARS
jgi:hypothetical protein